MNRFGPRTLAPALLLLALAPAALAGPELDGAYRVQGRDALGQAYAASGRLEFQGSAVAFERARAGQAPAQGTLTWRDGAWRGDAPFATGLSGALAGAPATPGGLEVVLRSEGGAVRVSWTWRVAGTSRGVGQETWTPAPAAPTAPLGPLMQSLVSSVRAAASRGNVPEDQVFTQQGNFVSRRILVEGPEIFQGVARLIEGAEREVLIQTFHWQDQSEPADQVVLGLQRLQARRQAAGATTPVRVHLVVDHSPLIKELRRNLDEARASIARAQLDPRFVTVESNKHTHLLYGVLHSKSVVVDGERALLLSANVHRQQNASPTPWFELGFEVAGPVARALRADFADLWRIQTKHDLPALPPLTYRAGDVPVLVTSRPWNGNPFSNSTKDPAARGFLEAIAGARDHIRIMSPHLNDDAIRKALVAAARRGVRVEVILSKGFGTSRAKLPFQGGTNTKNLGKLRDALKGDAAALARLDVRWFSRDGQAAIEGEGPGASHAKYMTIDDRIGIFGASNMDNQSLNWSREVNLIVESPEHVQAWDRQVFLPAYGRAIPAP